MINTQNLIGSWQLERWTITYSNSDRVSHPYGGSPQGLLVYTADGWMSAAIGRSDRKPFPAGKSPRELDPSIVTEAYSSYFHYAGTYRIQGDDVIHSVTQSMNPNMPGTEQIRHMALEGQHLTLRGEESMGDIIRYHELCWCRAATAEEA